MAASKERSGEPGQPAATSRRDGSLGAKRKRAKPVAAATRKRGAGGSARRRPAAGRRAVGRPRISAHYAATYVDTQQRYNAGRPSEQVDSTYLLVRDPEGRSGQTDRFTGEHLFVDPRTGTTVRIADHLEGEVLYWDLPVDDPRIEAIGEVEGSPFRVGHHYRQFVHYLDFARQAQLEAITGRGPKRMRAKMTSSYRTLQVIPARGEPFELKFAGEFRGGGKSLANDKVRTTIARSAALAEVPYLAGEPGALVMHDDRLLGGHNPVIYRPLTRPTRTGDLLLAATVVLSPEFARSQLGRSLFARHGGQAAWVERQFAPGVADLAERSVREQFLHLEAHQQNVDLVIARDGRIRRIVVKDMSDVVHDPALEAVMTGKLPDRSRSPRNTAFLDMGQAGSVADFGVEGFQQAWGLAYLFNPHGTAAAIARRVFARAQPEVQPGLAARVAGRNLPDASMFAATMDEYRNQLIIERLSDPRRGFRRDASARRWLDDRSRPLYAQYKYQAYSIPGSAEVGFVGKVPVAVTRDGDGRIDGFWLRLD